jgi:hypothetical protein
VAEQAVEQAHRRVSSVDKQGVTGRKVSYLTVPYRAITSFSIENAGSFDMDPTPYGSAQGRGDRPLDAADVGTALEGAGDRLGPERSRIMSDTTIDKVSGAQAPQGPDGQRHLATGK